MAVAAGVGVGLAGFGFGFGFGLAVGAVGADGDLAAGGGFGAGRMKMGASLRSRPASRTAVFHPSHAMAASSCAECAYVLIGGERREEQDGRTSSQRGRVTLRTGTGRRAYQHIPPL